MILVYGNGEIRLKEGKPIRGLQINYIGNIQAENKSNEGWMLRTGNRAMIFFNMDLNPNDIGEELLEYRGSLKIDNVIAAGIDGSQINVEVVKDVDEYDALNETLSNLSKDWDKLNVGLKKVGNKGRLYRRKARHISRNKVRTEAVTNNLTANKDKYKILETGEIYNGKYHLYGDGTMMTGATHTNDSREITYSAGEVQTLTPEKALELKVIVEESQASRTSTAPAMGTTPSKGY